MTTVVLFSDSALNAALMTEASKQAWYPEWFFTGSFFQDIAVLARGNPADEMTHAFGLSNFTPYISPALDRDRELADWYWGPNQGTTAGSAAFLGWLMLGIQTAGPKLTPKTFQQGMFSAPATGGAAVGSTISMMNGYGKTAGLPYDEYVTTGIDFAPIWWDAETTGPSQAVGARGQGRGLVRRRRQALPRRHLPEEAVHLVRQDGRAGLVHDLSRHAPGGGTGVHHLPGHHRCSCGQRRSDHDRRAVARHEERCVLTGR